MKHIDELKEKVASSNITYIRNTYKIFHDIETALRNRCNEDIQTISYWINESIDDYFSYQLDEAIGLAEKAVKDGKYNYEELFQPCNFKGGGKEWEPIIENIVAEFCVDTQENTTLNNALERILNYFYDDIQDLKQVKDYEIMAIMALKHIREALELSDMKYQKQLAKEEHSYIIDNNFLDEWLDIQKDGSIKSCIEACLAVNSMLSMKFNEDVFIKQKEAEKAILRKRASNAGRARHKKTNELKKKVMSEYKREAERYKENGRILSKNNFARQASTKYKIAETTIRNNWLKGLNI